MQFVPLGGQDTAFKQETFASTSLLVPSISIGNVSQLAVDLLLASAQQQQPDAFRRVGALNHPALAPITGNLDGPFKGSLAFPAEVYMDADNTMTVLQFRSFVSQDMRGQFTADLQTWIVQQKFKRVLILAGLDDSQRRDDQLHGVPLRAVMHDDSAKQAFEWLDTNIPALERRDPTASNPDGIYMPASGMARTLLKGLADQASPAAALVSFASHGPNVEAAALLADAGVRSLESPLSDRISKWTMPDSWELLWGLPPASGLF